MTELSVETGLVLIKLAWLFIRKVELFDGLRDGEMGDRSLPMEVVVFERFGKFR